MNLKSIKNSILIATTSLLLLASGCNKNEDTSDASSIPEIVTSNVINATVTTAQCGGNIISNLNSITQFGICYSKKKEPTINDSLTIENSGTNSFTSNIEGLTAGTTYYFRAYAINDKGIGYGITRNFTTPTIEISISNISSILINTAVSGGTITNYGENTVTERGVCWGEKINPTKNDSLTKDGTGLGTYTSKMKNLKANSRYYVRAYITTSKGTFYSLQKEFITYKATVKDADSIEYPVVQFGDKIWMNESLKTTHFNNGEVITKITDNTVWQNTTTPGYCLYNNNETVCGYLYNFYTVATNKLCPTGWHVPSTDEWTLLNNKFNEYKARFNVDLGGYRRTDGVFDEFGEYSYFWLSTSYSYKNSYFFEINSNKSNYYSNWANKNNGYSVRCVKD